MSETDEQARVARSNAICRTSAREWRAQAGHLREHAKQPHLTPAAAAALLRSAESCDEQAAWWKAGIVGKAAGTG